MSTDFDDNEDRHGLPMERVDTGTLQQHGSGQEHRNTDAALELMTGAQPMRTRQRLDGM
jgi:hypothetical protein